MTQPPQDGYGGPRYRGQRPPPPPVPQQPPPQPIQQPGEPPPLTPPQPQPQPPTSGFGYWDASEELPPPPPPFAPSEEEAPGESSAPLSRPLYEYGGLFADESTETETYRGLDRYEGYDSHDAYSDGYGSGYGGGLSGGGYGPGPGFGPGFPGQGGFGGYGPAPTGPQRAARSRTKLTVLLAGTVAGIVLAAGGVYYMVGGESDGGSEANASADGSSDSGEGSAGERPEGGKKGTAEADDFTGKWRSKAGASLTVGAAARSAADSEGRQVVAYNRPGGLSTCAGVGAVGTSRTSFRLALQCANGKTKAELAGDAVRARGKLTVEWEGGSKDVFALEGERGADGSGGRGD